MRLLQLLGLVSTLIYAHAFVPQDPTQRRAPRPGYRKRRTATSQSASSAQFFANAVAISNADTVAATKRQD